MDNLWSSTRVYSSKNFSAVSRFTSEGEGDDDARAACFPCPFCYVDIQLHVLCTHLQEAHCFDLNNAVCPLCAANLGKDPTAHFIVQHASSLKRRRRYPKSGSFSTNLPVLGQELSSFLGSSTNDKGSGHEFVPDHLLPPFLCSTTPSGQKSNQHDEYSSSNASVTASLQSAKQSQWDEVQEQNNEEKRMKAEFVQGLMESTLFLDFRST
ncbi:hypothetical protein ACFE04_018632 [Oxalis oulophora]